MSSAEKTDTNHPFWCRRTPPFLLLPSEDCVIPPLQHQLSCFLIPIEDNPTLSVPEVSSQLSCSCLQPRTTLCVLSLIIIISCLLLLLLMPKKIFFNYREHWKFCRNRANMYRNMRRSSTASRIFKSNQIK